MVPNKLLIGLVFALPVTSFAQELGVIVPDTPIRAANMEIVCTGVSLDARQNPAWASYPLKVEVAGRGGQYLGDVRVTLSKENKILATLHCGGPWILFRLSSGRYRVEAQTEGKTVSSAAFVPIAGQGRIILRFPDLGGEAAPPPSTDRSP